ncbi:MAG: NUDIX domain-containing protein [Pseudomonadota bacterium]
MLADNWGRLTRYEFNYLRHDGNWQLQVREAYDRGNGVAALLHDPAGDTVLLIKQFRLPALLNGHTGDLIEVPAGKMEGDDPAAHMRTELFEETGYRIGALECVFDSFMSPGSVTERLALFVGNYDRAKRAGEGGGALDEGEDIEVLHLRFDDAMNMVMSGEIVDAKTIILLQHMALSRR